MPLQLSEELTHARELIEQAKLDEALEVVENFEQIKSISSEDQLSALLIKGHIYSYNQEFEKFVKNSERAFQMSQDLGLVSESVEALIGRAFIAFQGDLEEASIYVSDAEKLLNSLADNPSARMLRRELLLIKSWVWLLKADTQNVDKAAESAKQLLELSKEEKLGNKMDLAATYLLLGQINLRQANPTQALIFAMKSLNLSKELDLAVAIADNYRFIAVIHYQKEEYDKAKTYCKNALGIKEITSRNKLEVLRILKGIYFIKGEINRALKYSRQAAQLAEKLNFPNLLIDELVTSGYLKRIKGNNKSAIEFFERALSLSVKWDFKGYMANSLGSLTMTYIDEKSREKANLYFSELYALHQQTNDKYNIPKAELLATVPVDISYWYLRSKAYIMKTSIRMRDRAEAQALYKELIDRTDINPEALFICIGNLCDLLLEELTIYNAPEILKEIMPLITKSLEMAKTGHNYHWLAETKLLQAKLALIQLNIKESKRLMVEAQRIADLHGLNLLAYKISGEHDKLLDQIDAWDKNNKEEFSMMEKVNLASTNEVLERMQGKRELEPPEMISEEPILLLIMDNSGATYFSHPFISNWDHSHLFSSFMSAFNTFMDEIFSNFIDRIKIKENIILMQPVEPFLVCYVIKGESYPALQKLTRFTEAIQENSEIWDALNKAIKTSEMLELEKPPTLKTIIDEIFI
ncbi:MAG: tetratricopeptide repeat protein [Promethearchaeota archaeon]|jgi:tetratricopeptide (TPR) repeat protein